MDTQSEQIKKLFAAELQFRLASAVRLAVTMNAQPLDLPTEWSHGKHKVQYKEIALRKDQADYAAWHLQNSATFLMAVAIKDAIKVTISDPKNHSDKNVRDAYQIARLIRNAFAHSPFRPVWSIDKDCQNKIFEVEDIIRLDTKNLQGTTFDWRHYGGPLAILKLCQFVRFEILKDSGRKPINRDIPDPETIYYQQGGLIIKKLNEIEVKNLNIQTEAPKPVSKKNLPKTLKKSHIKKSES
jgi:hypothetical protein